MPEIPDGGRSMLDADTVVDALEVCGFTHVVWIPDSHLGLWEDRLRTSKLIRLIRATREGEAIAIAGGLLLGGARPLVCIQCTGLYEAGDALRNIVHDLGLPLLLLVGVRSWQAAKQGRSSDNCPEFVEPILHAWRVPFQMIDPQVLGGDELRSAIRNLQLSNRAGVLLWGE